MAKCNFRECEREAIVEDKCILHCKKNDYAADFHDNKLILFTDALIEYILNEIYKDGIVLHYATREQVKGFLDRSDSAKSKTEDIREFIKKKDILIQGIIFPEHDDRDFYDYEKVLDKIGGIHFDRCEFFTSNLDLKKIKVFFQDCTFNKHWYLYNHNVLGNVRDVIYQMCKFNNNVSSVAADYEKPELDNQIFSDCIFSNELLFENVIIKSKIFRNSEEEKLQLKKLFINNCIIKEKFVLNNYELDEFSCYNTIFEDKLEFKRNNVKKFEVDNSNYKKLFDCYKTIFGQFLIKKSIFDDFVGFENCVFGRLEANNEENVVSTFKYATFMTFVTFRKAEFQCGLDLVHTNLKEPPNFLNVDINPQNTPRETYRIIKYSFDRVGNYIEANQFFEYEMRKYKEELKIRKKLASRFLLAIYEITSNYGQSYIRPIMCTLLTAIVYHFIVIGYEKNLLYSFLPSINPCIDYVTSCVNTVAKNILPFKNVLKEGMESITLLIYICFSSFIWLIILAIKRHTKR